MMTATKEERMKAKPARKELFIERYLDPVDRLAEVIYGILIVMTFTMAFRGIDALSPLPEGIAAAEMLNRLFWAAFGCALAWGLIDAVMYVITSLFERAESQKVVRVVHGATSEDEAAAVLGAALDDYLLESLTDQESDKLYRALYQRYRTQPLRNVSVEREDFYGAIATFVLAVVSTLPIVLPFLFIQDPGTAIRLSNLIAILMLFVVGFRWAKYVYANPWLTGLSLAVFGVVIVLIAIPLGG